jgi:hypothetical protein
VGLFLAAVGLYGMTAYVAGRRARECAIRRVVGASRPREEERTEYSGIPGGVIIYP